MLKVLVRKAKTLARDPRRAYTGWDDDIGVTPLDGRKSGVSVEG